MNRSLLLLTLMIAPSLLLLPGAAAHAQPEVLDEACVVALDLCSSNCAGLGDRVDAMSCVTRCNQAATTCFGDEEPTLSSEAYLAHFSDDLVFAQAAACHDTTPCPSEFGSCGTWSNFSDCGDPYCGVSTACEICNEWGQCTAGGPATKQDRERFRVCFNAQQEACTEYQRISQTLSCVEFC